jgi:hypothetical protein
LCACFFIAALIINHVGYCAAKKPATMVGGNFVAAATSEHLGKEASLPYGLNLQNHGHAIFLYLITPYSDVPPLTD